MWPAFLSPWMTSNSLLNHTRPPAATRASYSALLCHHHLTMHISFLCLKKLKVKLGGVKRNLFFFYIFKMCNNDECVLTRDITNFPDASNCAWICIVLRFIVSFAVGDNDSTLALTCS